MYKNMVSETSTTQRTDAQAAMTAAAMQGPNYVEDLTTVINALLTKHGSTLPHGYMAFVWGGHLSYLIEMSADVQGPMAQLATIASERRVDLNLLLETILKDAARTFSTDKS